MVLNKFDVLCGKGKEAQGHIGNKIYRETIAKHRNRYQNAKFRDEKTRITREIIASIQEHRGRFLSLNENTSMWYQVRDQYAHDKVSHALRTKDRQKKSQGRNTTVGHQPSTAGENQVFEELLAEQQRILGELVSEEMALEEDEHWYRTLAILME
jgi:hypothetical protein